MKKKMLMLLLVVALLAVATPSVLAWKEGPGTDWWYVNASGSWKNTVPLVIKIDENPDAGQVFSVGDKIDITVDIYAEAASCSGGGDEAYTARLLEVDGPSGPDSDAGSDYDWDTGYDPIDGCAEVETIETLTIVYLLTAEGAHTVYVNSYAAVSQYWKDVAEETVEASLTFEVVPAVAPVVLTKADILIDSGVPGKGLANAPGLQKPFNPKSKAAEHAGKKKK